jgi:DNA-binding response OmpR family regulator
MKLLIIDDEPHIRQMMRLTLEASGYAVEEAGDGEDGLARFGDGSGFDAVLLDQKMPGLDGLETLRRIRQRAADARVLMVTAFASIELAVDAMKLGAADFLRKPMTPDALRGAVAATLTGHPVPRPVPAPKPDAPARPRIETLTLNGFQIVRAGEPHSADAGEHEFTVRRFADGSQATVVVAIDPEAQARVARLSLRDLRSDGAFWRTQAERRLAAYLWSEGQLPPGGRVVVDDVSRDDLEVAASWSSD